VRGDAVGAGERHVAIAAQFLDALLLRRVLIAGQVLDMTQERLAGLRLAFDRAAILQQLVAVDEIERLAVARDSAAETAEAFLDTPDLSPQAAETEGLYPQAGIGRARQFSHGGDVRRDSGRAAERSDVGFLRLDHQ